MLQSAILPDAAGWYHLPALLFYLAAVCFACWLILRRVRQGRAWPRLITQLPAACKGQTREAGQQMLLIAHDHDVRGKSGRGVLRRINNHTFRELGQIRQYLSDAPADAIRAVPAARHLFDNYALIHRKLKLLQEKGSSRGSIRLPALAAGDCRGYPRAYLLAREITAALDNVSDGASIVAMLASYQQVRPLTSAELWALPDLISMCLLEEIVAAASEITAAVKIAADAVSSPGISVVEQAAGTVMEENRPENGLEVRISTLVANLKSLADLNWEEDFEKVSPMENVLRQDPAGVYNQMDRDTKNRCRWAVEKLAARSRLAEELVAEKAVEMAAGTDTAANCLSYRHVGFYLIGRGRFQLAESLTGRAHFRERLRTLAEKSRGFLYFVGILVVTALVLTWITLAVFRLPRPELRNAWLFLVFAVFPAMEIGVTLINHLFTRFIHPKSLPAMDYLEVIPAACRTYVVMPVILGSAGQAQKYVSRLEKHFLANRQENLCFAVLGDYRDAPARVMAEDQRIQAAAMEAVRELNRKYPAEKPRFSLFIRSRKWNASENCWMGWERKRGKLEEFNMLICGSQETSFTLISSDPVIYGGFRFVITLDADTELIRDSAAKLVGIMAHPLNRPVFDRGKNRIVDGYVIVQSEIRSRITAAQSSLFSRYFSGQVGIDPYASVVSDVYQDTFNEGIFVGKGIYDIQAMHQLLHGAIPENSVLSHDLLESCLTRCAFASGIKLMDACPSSIAAYAKREHRWIRGDWQLLPWLFQPSPVSGLSRWKLFENLRRSLMHVFYLLLIILNFYLLPDKAWLWLPIVLFSPFLQFLATVYSLLEQKMVNPSASIVWRGLRNKLFVLMVQTFFGFTFMPYRGYIALDAVIRTLYRVLISRRRMLEWQTAEAVEKKISHTLLSYLKMMWMSWLPAALILGLVFPSPHFSLGLGAGFIAGLWFAAPLIASFSSRPLRQPGDGLLRQDEEQALRSLARRTWNYFADFSRAENNYLCPDNYQLLPEAKLAKRTSPTNIGLQLLSLLAAWDFGFIGLLSCIENCEKVLATVESLPKWHGHLYNWYNIETLEVLQPDYVSTVDSGNFTGYLIVLKNGLLEMKDQPKSVDKDLSGCMPPPDFCRRIDCLAERIERIVDETDFRPLYDRRRQLFRIGYHVSAQIPDGGYYDLLASEARLASFLAVAKGDVPQKHWFRLGRPLTMIQGLPTFVSWSGSMFEYLMPDLVMKNYPGTALSISCLGAVQQQIAYADQQSIPWGISEAQYNAFDADGSYRYKAFGVPKLQLQSGLQPARVVAPYATLLALPLMPRQAMDNIQHLCRLGVEGRYGFYEALDFNHPRETDEGKFSLVTSFMAHHQGMSLIAIDNLLHRRIMVQRFHREPMVQATEILLEETRSVGVVVPISREERIINRHMDTSPVN